jgi:hypothetical protein
VAIGHSIHNTLPALSDHTRHRRWSGVVNQQHLLGNQQRFVGRSMAAATSWLFSGTRKSINGDPVGCVVNRVSNHGFECSTANLDIRRRPVGPTTAACGVRVGRSTATCWTTAACGSGIANQIEVEGDMLDVQGRPVGHSMATCWTFSGVALDANIDMIDIQRRNV